MKTLAMTAIATLMTTSAFAESQDWLLSENADWKVFLVDLENEPLSCVMENAEPEVGISFMVWTYGDGFYDIQLYDDTFDFEPGTSGHLVLQIDDKQPVVGAAVAIDESIFMNGLDDLEFLVDFTLGNTLYVLDDNGNETHWFSLDGTAASMVEFMNCAQSL